MGETQSGEPDQLAARAESMFDVLVELELTATRTPELFDRLAAAGEDFGAEQIRSDLQERRDDVLGEVATTRGEWQRAEDKLGEAEDAIRSEAPTRKILTTTVLGLLATGALAWLLFRLPIETGLRIYLSIVAGVFCMAPATAYLSRRLRLGVSLAVAVRKQAVAKVAARYTLALGEQVTVATRDAINRRLLSFKPSFRLYDDRGLRELSDPEREVQTTAGTDLKDLMRSLSSGSIGISGPRGAGKTTLIASFARGRQAALERERIGIVVGAPVKYEALDFVLHLFASLCERVLEYGGEDESAPSRLRGWQVALVRLSIVVGIVLTVSGGMLLLFRALTQSGFGSLAESLLILAAVVFYMLFLFSIASDAIRGRIVAWVRKALRWEPPADRRTPERMAEEHLDQIRFQRSFSSSWSGSLRLASAGVGVSRSVGLSKARVPWTLPEAVAEFRRFAGWLAQDRYLVVGIDELDKMESDEAARQFLNNVKGVFGVSSCYYLVSVSEDAMSSFERRGLPIRDVFDSSFDAMQRVGYLSLAESRQALQGRVIGLPLPFQCLCHCLSGGLPRDLVRVARELVQRQRRTGLLSLDRLCRELVRLEAKRKLAAAMEAMRTGSDEYAEWVVKWLDRQLSGAGEVESFRQAHEELAAWESLRRDAAPDPDERRARELALEIDAFNYYAATAVELFGEEERLVALLEPSVSDPEVSDDAAAVLEELAGARQRFSVSPWLAWERVTEARSKCWLGDPWRDPREGPAQRGDGKLDGSQARSATPASHIDSAA